MIFNITSYSVYQQDAEMPTVIQKYAALITSGEIFLNRFGKPSKSADSLETIVYYSLVYRLHLSNN